MATATFRTFYKTLSSGEKTALAEKANTSTQYLYLLATGRRRAGIQTCAKLKQADGRITDAMMRPDLYA